MSISRSWTPIEDDPRWEDEGYYEQIKAEADGIMLWWSQLATEIEEEGFIRQQLLEDGIGYDPGEDYPMGRDYDGGADSEEYKIDVAAYEAQMQEWNDNKRAEREKQQLQIEFCEDRLNKLGARPMRPYEHWNEDEKFMEWSERDR